MDIKIHFKRSEIKKLPIETLASGMLQTVKRFLKGTDQKGMSSAMAFKIAKALEVPIHVLFHKDYQ